ncbi:MAG: C-type lectin domain-containing protein, partial [Firmicutes bacterium]|nr:C-type lectin domain-containing protein [Bacillota bacterium]
VVLILLIAIVIILIRRNGNHSADASGQIVYEENSRRPSGADSASKGESSMNPSEKQAENGSNGASGENASGEEASASKANASGSDGSADPSGTSTSAAGESSAASDESAAAQQESSPGVPVIELSCGASFPQDIQIMVLSGYAISSLEELEQFPNLIQVDVRDTLVSSEAFAAYKAAHPQVELIGYSHSEYTVVEQDVTWDQAKALAEQAGGHLATLSDASELDLIIAQCQNMDLHYVWLGGYSDENRNWYWVTGEPWQDPGRWYPGEPTYIDEDGATENRLCLWNINEKGWTLNDQRNDLTGFNIVQGHLAYVIERETQSGIR